MKDICYYRATNKKLPYCRKEYKADCGFLYAKMSGKDNESDTDENCMKCGKPIKVLGQADCARGALKEGG